MNKIEYLANIDKYKGEDHSVFLEHYGILGQKWGTRRWQNADGTFNEEGKQRYFGKSSEEKVGSAKSEAKDYLKFRNKMLKERTRPDLNQWYREQHKKDDRLFVKNAKKVDKSREKMYKDQLKDFYDDPNELVADLKSVYKVSGNRKTAGDMRVAGLFGKKKIEPKYQNEDGSLTEEGKQFFATNDTDKINKVLDMNKYRKWKDKMTKDNVFDDEKKLAKLTKDLGLPEKGEYKWEDDIKTIIKLRKDLYNTIEGNKQLSDNADNIVKLVKAKENNNEEEYNRIFDGIKDSDKSIVESFVNDVNKTKDWYKDAEEIMKEVNSSQTQNIKKYMENIWGDPKIKYDNADFGKNEGKIRHPGVYDLEDYTKGSSKATQSIKELDKNADAHFDKILDKLYNNLMDFSGTLNVWDEDHNKLSKSEFKDYMKDQKYKLVNSGHVSDNGNVSLYLNDADLYWGHVFGIDYNPLTGEFNYHGIEG